MRERRLVGALLIAVALVLGLLPGFVHAQEGPTSAPRAAASQSARPVVALGDLATRGVSLSPQVAAALKGLLQAKLAGSGVFRLIPEKTVGDRLRSLRRKGVQACGSDDCLMELGKALAASRVLLPELVRFGGRCMAVLTLYEVRSATAELATTEECACEESGFLAASLKASMALARAFGQKVSGATTSPHSVTTDGSVTTDKVAEVSIFVASKPSYAPIWVDGERVGRTPKLLILKKGVSHRLKVGAWPYRPVERVVTPQRWQRLQLRLALDREDAKTVATTREWFAFGFLGGWAPASDEPLFGTELRILQWRWSHLIWTAFEVRYAAAVSGESPLEAVLTLATRVAYPLYWGRNGTHQLQLGLGAGYWSASFSYDPSRETSRAAFALLPSLDYLYLLGNGGFSVGLGINVALPMRAGIGTEEVPLTLSIGLKFGISPEPTMRADAQGKVVAREEK